MLVPICVSVAPPDRRARRADRLRDAEVGHDGRAAGHEHIVRLDVAMHHAALVRVGERLERHRAGCRSTSVTASGPRASRARSDSPSRTASCSTAGRSALARGEHRHDVRLLQRGDRLDLALETLDADSLRELRREDLHDDLALERGSPRPRRPATSRRRPTRARGCSCRPGSLEAGRATRRSRWNRVAWAQPFYGRRRQHSAPSGGGDAAALACRPPISYGGEIEVSRGACVAPTASRVVDRTNLRPETRRR